MPAARSGSNGLFFPDRVSLPFVTTEYPPGSPISDNERIDIPWFPLRNWATDWYSWLVLTQFVTITEWDSFDISSLLGGDGRLELEDCGNGSAAVRV